MPTDTDTDTGFDVAFARRCFPALSPEWALFDNAGGSVTAQPVVDRVTEYMSTLQVQLGASYALSQRASALVADGHAAAATWLGAEVDEVVLGPSTTVNLRRLARALAANWRPGDEVVVTDLDHEANVGAWLALERHGIAVKRWTFDRATGRLDPAALAPLLGPRTRLVAFTHCSNVIGAIEDVPAIVELAHAAGALVCVDGVAYAPHRFVDVKRLDVDFYAYSTYKVFGPHLAALYGKREHLQAAGNENHFFVGAEEVPRKLEPGGVSHELAAALPGTWDYMEKLADHHGLGHLPSSRRRLEAVFDRICRHEEDLVGPLLEFLRGREGVRILGPEPADASVRVPIVGFVVDGHRSSTVTPKLDAHGVAVRFGDFYAPRAVARLGLTANDGIVRVSMAHYNSADEVDRLIGALDQTMP
ncbi:MAG: cysteine desulfurase-like protein [Myxococcales bacterium FL481]|nr:MAG: cysteine desulfurase-like protein [Myxococcales bacterium FL481]